MVKKKRGRWTRAKPDDPIYTEGLQTYTPTEVPGGPRSTSRSRSADFAPEESKMIKPDLVIPEQFRRTPGEPAGPAQAYTPISASQKESPDRSRGRLGS